MKISTKVGNIFTARLDKGYTVIKSIRNIIIITLVTLSITGCSDSPVKISLNDEKVIEHTYKGGLRGTERTLKFKVKVTKSPDLKMTIYNIGKRSIRFWSGRVVVMKNEEPVWSNEKDIEIKVGEKKNIQLWLFLPTGYTSMGDTIEFNYGGGGVFYINIDDLK